MYNLNEVAQSEFGLDYNQLGRGEKEWVTDQIEIMGETCRNGKDWNRCECC